VPAPKPSPGEIEASIYMGRKPPQAKATTEAPPPEAVAKVIPLPKKTQKARDLMAWFGKKEE